MLASVVLFADQALTIYVRQSAEEILLGLPFGRLFCESAYLAILSVLDVQIKRQEKYDKGESGPHHNLGPQPEIVNRFHLISKGNLLSIVRECVIVLSDRFTPKKQESPQRILHDPKRRSV